MGKEDRRTRRTRQMIKQALIDLTVEKGFSAVTVHDIAERAMINRATFYRYYLDKYDLLEQYMNVVYELTTPQEPAPVASTSIGPAPPTGLVSLLEHVQQHAEFYRVMLGKHGDAAFTQRMRGYIEQRFRQTLVGEQTRDGSHVIPLSLCLSYVSHAGVGAIAWWLEGGCTCSPMELATWLNELTQANLALVLGQRTTDVVR